MRAPVFGLSMLATCWAAIAATLPCATAVAADEPAVVAALAIDPYADLKKQARWVGGLVDQPQLDGFLESFIMMATQFKGLAGLDVNRPIGVVVTAEGPAGAPVVRGLVPVKNLGALLAALQGTIGPAQEQDGAQVISPPGMPPLEIVERDGWAIVAPQGSPAAAAGLEATLDPIVKSFSLGVQVFPARMPEGMRQLLAAMLQQAAAMQAQQGQPVDAEALAVGLRELENVETILLGINVDVDKERVYLENRFAMEPDSAAGTLYGDMAKATPTVPATATADGKPAAVRLHAALAVPEQLRTMGKARLAEIRERMPAVVGAQAAVFDAMLDADTIDCMFAIDPGAADFDAGKPLAPSTFVMKIKDGAALEATLKKLLATPDPAMPNVAVKFDAGKAGGATLHRVSVDLAGGPNADKLGNKLDLTIAIAPQRAALLMGGDVDARAAAAAGGGKPDPDAKPLAGLDLALAPLVKYATDLQAYLEPEHPGLAAMSGLAEGATALSSSLVQVLVRPIDRGMATRLSADAGAIKTIKSIFDMQLQSAKIRAPQPGGLGPGPVPKGRAIPLPGLAP